MRIDFVFSNPGHHLAMMKPVAETLAARHEVRLVSLAELRGFRSPKSNGVPVVRAIPLAFRENPNTGDVALGQTRSPRRRLLQTVAWHGALGPRMRQLLHGAACVVVPNDAAFPYAQLVRTLRAPFVLMQEGIRFPLPNESNAETYGQGGAAAVCCWGEAAAEHFSSIGAGNLRITGNPRYDDLDPAKFRAAGDALLAKLGLTERPLLYLSNPIDDQGFCTTAQKMALFDGFVRQVPGHLPIVVKLHPREDANAYRRPRVHVVTDASLFAVLAAGRAAVVLASTVGLEALLFDLPLGVLAIPGHGHVFEYVAQKAAVPLALGDDFTSQLDRLLAGPAPGAVAMVERYLANRGSAVARVASTIESVLS